MSYCEAFLLIVAFYATLYVLLETWRRRRMPEQLELFEEETR